MNLPEILVLVATAFDLTPADLRTPTKKQTIVPARDAAVELARVYTDYSPSDVAAYLGLTKMAISNARRRLVRHRGDAEWSARFGAIVRQIEASIRAVGRHPRRAAVIAAFKKFEQQGYSNG